MQLWLLGSLALYVLIQVVIVGYAAPRTGRLASWAYSLMGVGAETLPPAQAAPLRQIGGAHLLAGLLGVALFVLMILKPSRIIPPGCDEKASGWGVLLLTQGQPTPGSVDDRICRREFAQMLNVLTASLRQMSKMGTS